ncbi:MAG: ankyrin repeat domain-containing protein [Nitrospira sp.]|nr:ankyrin repeat domain-containing protein [Nitrospira sp.]
MITAAAQGNTTIIQLLLDRGADINATTTDGWTALRKAAAGTAQFKEAGALELLKRAGAKE